MATVGVKGLKAATEQSVIVFLQTRL